jgi:hypothetical protein
MINPHKGYQFMAKPTKKRDIDLLENEQHQSDPLELVSFLRGTLDSQI